MKMETRNALPKDFDFILKEIFINSIQIEEQFQRKGLGTEVINWLLKEARKFFAKNKFEFFEETKSGILVERRVDLLFLNFTFSFLSQSRHQLRFDQPPEPNQN